MTIDAPGRRLFLGCNNEKMAVADADFNANRATVTIAHKDSRDAYSVLQSLQTLPRVNTQRLI